MEPVDGDEMNSSSVVVKKGGNKLQLVASTRSATLPRTEVQQAFHIEVVKYP